MKTNVVNWFEIYVDDMDRAKGFYEQVFATTLNELPTPNETADMKMFAFPWEENAPYAAGALVKSQMSGPSASGTIVYFHCEDCATEESRVADAGGVVLLPKMAIGEHGFISLLKDTEGNTIGLHSLK